MRYGDYLSRKTQKTTRGLKKTMTINFISLIFIWLLPLKGSSVVTSGQNQNITNVRTGEETENKFTQGHLTTQETSILNPLSEFSGHNITPSTTADVNPADEKTTKITTKPFLQITLTGSSTTFLSVNQKAAPPTNSKSYQLNSSREGKSTTDIQVTTSATAVLTGQARIPNTIPGVPPILSSSTQSHDKGKTLTSQLTSDIVTHPPTHPAQSTQLISTTTTSTIFADKSTSTSQKPLHKTSLAMTKTRFIHITRENKRQDPPENKAKSNKGANHSKAVAGIIGGALILMMLGFLVIFIKKRKLQKQQISTTDWAGPSPFLESGADNGHVTLRSPNRISLSSFLPQRLSKRLSLLPETNQELIDMSPGTTFGDKRDGNTFGQQEEANYVQESNGTAAITPEMKSTGDIPKTV